MSSLSNETQTKINNINVKEKNVITINANSSESYTLQMFNSFRVTVVSGIEIIYNLALNNCRLTISQFNTLALLIWSNNGIKSLEITNNISVKGLDSKTLNDQLAEFFYANISLKRLYTDILFTTSSALKIMQNKNISSLMITIYINNYVEEKKDLEAIISDYAINKKTSLIITLIGDINKEQAYEFQLALTRLALNQDSCVEIIHKTNVEYPKNNYLPTSKTLIFEDVNTTTDYRLETNKRLFLSDFLKKYWEIYGLYNINDLSDDTIIHVEKLIFEELELFFYSYGYDFDKLSLNAELLKKIEDVDSEFFIFCANSQFNKKIRELLQKYLTPIMHKNDQKEHFLDRFINEYKKVYKIINNLINLNDDFDQIENCIYTEIEAFFVDKNVYEDYFVKEKIIGKIYLLPKDFFMFNSVESFRIKVKQILNKNFDGILKEQDIKTVKIRLNDPFITPNQYKNAAEVNKSYNKYKKL